MNNYSKLQEVLKEIFEMDKADLDFGIYRIMNQKRDQVMDFIDRKLPEEIKNILAQTQSKDSLLLTGELDQLGKSLDNAGVVRESSPKYLELKQLTLNAVDKNALEQEVFSHLGSFFKRYYKEGDFISLRRYKKDVYAIPYEGEEVKLHWANHDQYYIKTSEHLKNYAFKLSDGKKVHFQLKEASTEQNNNKTQGDEERRFAIYSELPVEIIDDELYINFTYETHKKTIKQDELSKKALELIQKNIPSAFTSAFDKVATEKNKNRTLLEKHLNDFVSRNSFDYFIHKDLGGFLKRELDFYIKNEVLFIDDINTENPIYFTAQLSKIKALKSVANKIISFLAQIENFQKKLWLKKKFVISTNYCITIDKIPEKYYEEIFSNKAQVEGWKSLYDVTLKGIETLSQEKFLLLDTKYFPEEFNDKLLSEFDNFDDEIDGVLINSENFQALTLMREKYEEKIDVNYIDPPYNTSDEGFLYKNDYKHSSWYSLMLNRVELSKKNLKLSGVLCCAIDDLEFSALQQVIDLVFSKRNRLGNLVIEIKPSGRTNDKYLATSHEYILVYASNFDDANISFFPLSKEQVSKYKEGEGEKLYKWRDFLRTGGFSTPSERPNSYYAIYYCEKSGKLDVENFEGATEIYPIDSTGKNRVWRKTKPSLLEHIAKNEITVKKNKEDLWKVKIIDNIKDGIRPKSVWVNAKYDASSHGTKLLQSIFGESISFSFPKSINAVYDTLYINCIENEKALILDYFAGSGTTGHATIKLNREDGGQRKYILVEMGTYFNTVTKPRIQKVIYSDNWKNGKPQDKVGISQMFKYQVLESYEDALNNLQLSKSNQDGLFQLSEIAQEEYLLNYMLDVETQDHLFNIEMFRNPFNYQLKVTENNELVPTTVDLVETFNYLVGMYVDRIQRIKDIKIIEGKTREGEKTLIIWRNLNTTTHEEVATVYRKLYDSVRSAEFDQIYINGDHHFDNLRTAEDQFKVKLIEETFFKKMFNITEL